MNLPEGFSERMRALLGEEYDAFEQALLSEKSSALRVNRLKRRAGSEAFLRERFSLSEVPWCADGFLYREEERPGKCALHEAGAYYIQEPSAMSAAELLFAGQACLGAGGKALRVLDLCAAPGGKSTQIASHMKGKGLLWSNEIIPSRAKILSQNVERMGIPNAIVSCEAPEALAARLPGFFDRVLVDAPCSGEGMFRKSEEALTGWSLENIQLCAARQKDILRAADQLLAPGGLLVYSTCTFAPEEDEQTAKWLMDTLGYELLDLRNVPVPGREGSFGDFFAEGFPKAVRIAERGLSETEDRFLSEGVSSENPELRKCFRLFPHRLTGEGHFAAVFLKPGDPAESRDLAYTYAEGRSFSYAYAESGETVGGKPRKGTADARKKEGKKAAGNRKNPEAEELVRFLKSEILAETPINFLNTEILAENPILEQEVRLLPFGSTWYSCPAGAPDLSGLRILRPGLELAEKKGTRFEPAHALALALGQQDVCHSVNISEADPRAAAFFRGEGFPFEGEKGWYLICVEGYSAGWGKCDGRQMKNHLPKGLRREVG
ncbi:MAG: RsmF rRNA methyltransferase first C-terminal domain-containing protein [Lachnospiraceae bacterium]|nr:RsmF rRNA methyltransferase first C-terminal domain-containing protein [Lachnospiraceae bacterium]